MGQPFILGYISGSNSTVSIFCSPSTDKTYFIGFSSPLKVSRNKALKLLLVIVRGGNCNISSKNLIYTSALL